MSDPDRDEEDERDEEWDDYPVDDDPDNGLDEDQWED